MSASDVDVMQKKPDDTPVIWREYEALRDHLERIITRTTDTIDSNIQAVQMKVEATDATVNNMQVQVNDLQTSIQALTQSINALCLTVEQRPPPHIDADDASAHGDNAGLMAEAMVPLFVAVVLFPLAPSEFLFSRMMAWVSQSFLFPNSRWY
jgi:hypothetical protein